MYAFLNVYLSLPIVAMGPVQHRIVAAVRKDSYLRATDVFLNVILPASMEAVQNPIPALAKKDSQTILQIQIYAFQFAPEDAKMELVLLLIHASAFPDTFNPILNRTGANQVVINIL